VQLDGRLGILAEDVDLRRRLEHEVAVFALLEREPILPKRLVEIALLAEREPEIVARELAVAAHLHLATAPLLAGRDGVLVALRLILLDGQIRLRARQRG